MSYSIIAHVFKRGRTYIPTRSTTVAEPFIFALVANGDNKIKYNTVTASVPCQNCSDQENLSPEQNRELGDIKVAMISLHLPRYQRINVFPNRFIINCILIVASWFYFVLLSYLPKQSRLLCYHVFVQIA